VIDEHVADEKAAKKRFRVPATSLEALSAIRRCCRDMEALFSVFHVGDVGVGVVGGCHGCWVDGLVASWMCGCRRWVSRCQSSGMEEKPSKPAFTGLGR